jgi:DNA-binding transcriptional LysR family regulator
MMELRLLKYFVAVAEELHFGRAAQRVHISQPPLSQQIKNLEDELGVKLLKRSSRKVALTEAGVFFLKRAHSILSEVDAAVVDVRSIAKGEAGRLNVGFISSAMDGNLPAAMREFRKTYPRIALILSEMETKSQLKALQSGKIQVGIARLFKQDITNMGLVADLFIREPYVLALPERHPLCSRKKVPLDLLKDEPLIMYPRDVGPALYDTMMKAFTAADVTPHIVQEARTKRAMVAFVGVGLGVALVPFSTSNIHRKGVVFRPIVGEIPMVEISVIWQLESETPTLDHFRRILHKHRQI